MNEVEWRSKPNQSTSWLKKVGYACRRLPPQAFHFTLLPFVSLINQSIKSIHKLNFLSLKKKGQPPITNPTIDWDEFKERKQLNKRMGCFFLYSFVGYEPEAPLAQPKLSFHFSLKEIPFQLAFALPLLCCFRLSLFNESSPLLPLFLH